MSKQLNIIFLLLGSKSGEKKVYEYQLKCKITDRLYIHMPHHTTKSKVAKCDVGFYKTNITSDGFYFKENL